MNRCGVYAFGIFWGLMMLLSVGAIIGGAVCMHADCPISQTASQLYVILGLTMLFLLLIVGAYSVYRCRRFQSYTEI